MEPIIYEEKPEQAFLVALDTGEYDVEISLAELAELAQTAGATVLGALVQKRESPDKATCIGSGRLEELIQLCRNTGADLVIFDRELTATQHRNLESELNCRVVDRTALILDIFAGRARSAEGRLQVELAQLQYLLPRLAGQGTALSRLGGGIGTRGPGEATGGTFAGGFTPCGCSWTMWSGSGNAAGNAAARMACRRLPSWAIPTRANPPFSTP